MPMVSRDPFAREEVHYRKVTVAHDHDGCANCDRKLGNMFRWLKQFYTETDGGTKRDISGLFCSVGCMRDYHDLPR